MPQSGSRMDKYQAASVRRQLIALLVVVLVTGAAVALVSNYRWPALAWQQQQDDDDANDDS